MKKIKTGELEGVALDYMVCKAAGLLDAYRNYARPLSFLYYWGRQEDPDEKQFLCPSTSWENGGPIIEREKIGLSQITRESGELVWVASAFMVTRWGYGPTPLIAAMRCYVASKLGETVEVPEELL